MQLGFTGFPAGGQTEKLPGPPPACSVAAWGWNTAKLDWICARFGLPGNTRSPLPLCGQTARGDDQRVRRLGRDPVDRFVDREVASGTSSETTTLEPVVSSGVTSWRIPRRMPATSTLACSECHGPCGGLDGRVVPPWPDDAGRYNRRARMR